MGVGVATISIYVCNPGGGGRKLTHLRPEVIHLNGRRGEAINDRESLITGVIVACDTCFFSI